MKFEKLEFLTEKDVTILNDLSKLAKVKIEIIDKEDDFIGYADFEADKILINKRYNKKRELFLSVFFHELSHFMRFEQFPEKYHITSNIRKLNSSKLIINAVTSIYKEELDTDRQAKKMFDKLYSDEKLTYRKGYQDPVRATSLLFSHFGFAFHNFYVLLLRETIYKNIILAKKYGWYKNGRRKNKKTSTGRIYRLSRASHPRGDKIAARGMEKS